MTEIQKVPVLFNHARENTENSVHIMNLRKATISSVEIGDE